MPHQDDHILLSRLKDGDDTAFADIYEKYSQYLALEATYHLYDPVAAQDLVQDLFTQWWRNRSLHKLTFREKVQFKTYLQRSIRYSCGKYNILQGKKQASVNFLTRNQEVMENSEPTANNELDARIRKYLDELPEKPKQALTMVYLEELKRQHITEELGITAKTLRNHLSNGLSILRKKLNNSM